MGLDQYRHRRTPSPPGKCGVARRDWYYGVDRQHRDDPLALYVKLAERPSHEVSRDLRPGVLRDRHSSGFAFCNHPRGDVDGVTLDVELVPLLPHDAGNDWASV